MMNGDGDDDDCMRRRAWLDVLCVPNFAWMEFCVLYLRTLVQNLEL